LLRISAVYEFDHSALLSSPFKEQMPSGNIDRYTKFCVCRHNASLNDTAATIASLVQRD
jgi:hypothetical protein